MDNVRDIPLDLLGALKICDANGLRGYANKRDVTVDAEKDQLVVTLSGVKREINVESETLRFNLNSPLRIEDGEMIIDDDVGDEVFITAYVQVTFD